jgi:Ca2+-binding EF-hand superfamily protein
MHQEDIDHAREMFQKYDADQSGTIDDDELEQLLTDLGYNMTPEETLRWTTQVAERPSAIVLSEFLDFLRLLKDNAASLEDVQDLEQAYVSMGGDPNSKAGITKEQMEKLVQNFELPIEIDSLMQRVDKNGNGKIEFSELKALLD